MGVFDPDTNDHAHSHLHGCPDMASSVTPASTRWPVFQNTYLYIFVECMYNLFGVCRQSNKKFNILFIRMYALCFFTILSYI